jgi:hypothetical protein
MLETARLPPIEIPESDLGESQAVKSNCQVFPLTRSILGRKPSTKRRVPLLPSSFKTAAATAAPRMLRRLQRDSFTRQQPYFTGTRAAFSENEISRSQQSDGIYGFKPGPDYRGPIRRLRTRRLTRTTRRGVQLPLPANLVGRIRRGVRIEILPTGLSPCRASISNVHG